MAVWLRVPISLSRCAAAASTHGFTFHHARHDHAVLSLWLGEAQSRLPGFATHQVGVAGRDFTPGSSSSVTKWLKTTLICPQNTLFFFYSKCRRLFVCLVVLHFQTLTHFTCVSGTLLTLGRAAAGGGAAILMCKVCDCPPGGRWYLLLKSGSTWIMSEHVQSIFHWGGGGGPNDLSFPKQRWN